MEKYSGIKIYCDGGARGNPGPAACAFVAVKNNRVIFQGKKYLGVATNNVAEYSAVILALEYLSDNLNINFTEAIFILDSELVTRQLNGIYKIKNINLKNLYLKVKLLEKNFSGKVNYLSVPRSNNKEADLLVNITLDENH